MSEHKMQRMYLKTILKLCLGAVITAGLSSIAFADQAGDTTIAVKFENIDFPTTPATVAGVDAVQTANWNLLPDGATGSVSSLNQDISGAATPLSLSLMWNASGVFTSFATAFGDARFNGIANAELLYGGLGSETDTATITLTGLDSTYSNGFSLYIYTDDTVTNNRGGTFTVDGGTPQGNFNTDPNSPPNAWIQSTSASTSGDYVLIAGLSGSILTISMTGVPIENEIQGFEIVANPVATPEPSTYALLVGGLLVLGFVARRRCENDKLSSIS